MRGSHGVAAAPPTSSTRGERKLSMRNLKGNRRGVSWVGLTIAAVLGVLGLVLLLSAGNVGFFGAILPAIFVDLRWFGGVALIALAIYLGWKL